MQRQLLFVSLFLSYCLLATFSALGQSLTFNQAHLVGPQNGRSTTVDSQLRDQAGNSYVSGSFFGVITFGTTTLTSNGGFDTYLYKQDAAGNYLWVQQIGGAGSEGVSRLAIDAANNVYLAAQTQSPSLSLGSLTLSLAQADIVVAQVNAAGTFQWATKAGNTPTTSGTQLLAVALDPNNNLCLTGYFTGSVAFGATTLNGAGGSDAFVAKISTTGMWNWALRIGGTNGDAGRGLAVDTLGNIYLTGSFAGYVGADPGVAFGSTIFHSGNSGTDIFVAKLTATGTFIWAVKAGGADGSDDGYSLALDAAGNPYITGNFSRTASFGTLSLTSAGNFDFFVAKLNPTTGGFLWATRGGGGDYDYGDVLVSKDNELYVATHYFGTTTVGTSTYTSAGQTDIVLCQLSDTGALLSSVGAGSTGSDLISSLLAVGQRQVYAAGYFLGTSIRFGSTTLTGLAAGNKPFIALATSSGVLATRAALPAQALAVWPNPTNGAFHLTNVDVTQVIAVYDTQGRLLGTYSPQDALRGELILPSGLYVVRNGQQTTRVCVR
jgi:hypothetical protein